MLKQYTTVSSSNLYKTFNVTQETIRKDLEFLEKKKMLRRIYGGAILTSDKDSLANRGDLPFDSRKIENYEEKDAIGKMAASMVEPQDTIVLDASTTTLQMVKYLPEDQNITVITNAFSVLCELTKKKGIHIICLGGSYRSRSTSFLGSVAVRNLETYNINKAFISCEGVSIERGTMESIEQETEVKKQMIEKADNSVLLVDSGKFSKIAPLSSFAISVFSTVITDNRLPKSIMDRLESLKIHVVVAN
jgi:DeoR family transcriptional regulator of aga operon